jgi:acetoacetyl-CoA synthetase
MTLTDQAANNGDSEPAKVLWRPTSPQSTRIHQFKSLVARKYGLRLDSYHDLWRWSVDNPAQFWEETWHFTAIKSHKPYDTVCLVFDIINLLFPFPATTQIAPLRQLRTVDFQPVI